MLIDMNKVIFDLCSVCGVSGDEKPAINIVKSYLDGIVETVEEKNNSLIAVTGNVKAEKTILLDAHIDRIGFVVTDIDSNGFVKIDKCGGVDTRTLQDTVVVLQKNTDITGVICCLPPHLSDGSESKATPMNKTWVDFGMPYDKVKEYIQIGDTLTFAEQPKQLLNGRISAPALDNRSSVAALIRCAELISDKKELDYKVVLLFSSQEETFGTGARTQAFGINPDEAIAVDVSFASQPDISGQYSGIELGKGPMICLSSLMNKEMSNKLIEFAKEKDIPFQLEPLAGTTGTNGDHIAVSKGGVKTTVVSVPQRYMHTPVEVVSTDDVENTAKLLAEYIVKGGAFRG